MKTNFFAFLSLFLILSCNHDKKKQNLIEETVEKKKELTVKMQFKTNKNDDLSYIMKDIKVDEFQTKIITINEKVVATSSVDNFEASFGENNISYKFEIDLGNKEIKDFEIISIKFSYGDNDVIILPDDLEKYFGLSKFSLYNSESKIIKTRKVDNYHFPKLYARKQLWDELKK